MDNSPDYQWGLMRGELDAVSARVERLHSDVTAGFESVEAAVERLATRNTEEQARLWSHVRSLERYRSWLLGVAAALAAVWAVGSKVLSIMVGLGRSSP